MYEAKITGHQFSRQPHGAEEKVTEREVEHQQGGAGPQVRVLSLVSVFMIWVETFRDLLVLPESAHTDGDDGEEVAETSDSNYKYNVHDLQNLQPRKHCLHLWHITECWVNDRDLCSKLVVMYFTTFKGEEMG